MKLVWVWDLVIDGVFLQREEKTPALKRRDGHVERLMLVLEGLML